MWSMTIESKSACPMSHVPRFLMRPMCSAAESTALYELFFCRASSLVTAFSLFAVHHSKMSACASGDESPNSDGGVMGYIWCSSVDSIDMIWRKDVTPALAPPPVSFCTLQSLTLTAKQSSRRNFSLRNGDSRNHFLASEIFLIDASPSLLPPTRSLRVPTSSTGSRGNPSGTFTPDCSAISTSSIFFASDAKSWFKKNVTTNAEPATGRNPSGSACNARTSHGVSQRLKYVLVVRFLLRKPPPPATLSLLTYSTELKLAVGVMTSGAFFKSEAPVCASSLWTLDLPVCRAPTQKTLYGSAARTSSTSRLARKPSGFSTCGARSGMANCPTCASCDTSFDEYLYFPPERFFFSSSSCFSSSAFIAFFSSSAFAFSTACRATRSLRSSSRCFFSSFCLRFISSASSCSFDFSSFMSPCKTPSFSSSSSTRFSSSSWYCWLVATSSSIWSARSVSAVSCSSWSDSSFSKRSAHSALKSSSSFFSASRSSSKSSARLRSSLSSVFVCRRVEVDGVVWVCCVGVWWCFGCGVFDKKKLRVNVALTLQSSSSPSTARLVPPTDHREKTTGVSYRRTLHTFICFLQGLLILFAGTFRFLKLALQIIQLLLGRSKLVFGCRHLLRRLRKAGSQRGKLRAQRLLAFRARLGAAFQLCLQGRRAFLLGSES
eukprot:Rhum_TRINITY_DN15030_c6_g1::Rhum_TRINITY_DN15030_c6_g1_i4::g.133340::m.133340